VISTASRKLLDIRREEDTGDVLVVGFEVGNRDEGGFFSVLDEKPDKDIALFEFVSYD